MNNTGVRRNYTEVIKRLLPPAKKFVSLLIAFELDLDVAFQCIRSAEPIDLNRMVNDQIDRNQWVDFLRIATQLAHPIPHRRQVDHTGNAGEVLQYHSCRFERNLQLRRLGRIPNSQILDVVFGHLITIAVS